MKRSAFFLLMCAVVTWSACGGGGGSSNTKPLSHVKDRVFVSNFYSTSGVDIVDAAHDRVAFGFLVATGNGASTMYSSPNGKITLVHDQGSGDLYPIDNTTENLISTASTAVALGGVTESVALASDNKTGYAAVRNYNNGSGVALGAVLKFDYTTGTVSTTIPVPAAHWIALNHAGTTLLVMTDVSDSITVIDLTQTTPTQTTVAGFSRPVAAFFSSDDSHAYLVNCGPECGGTQAGVTELVMSSKTLGRTVNVSSARVAMMVNSTIYVAGSPSGSGGTAQTVDTGAFTAAAPVTIGLGQKSVIKYLASKVWIGSINCLNTGCFSLWDPTSNSVTIDNPAAGANSKGNVTGFALITSSNRIFAAEGGELHVYDTSLNEQATTMDIVGQAYDVIYAPQ